MTLSGSKLRKEEYTKLRQVFYHFTNLYLRDPMMLKMTLARILTAILGEENANKAKC